jgi:mannose-1-phosphate guanylyltransferase / mannose-6-phosphate isomerase
MTFRITPVILCGGSGTRLWPLSRKCFPKQFAKLLGDRSLFASSARRMSGKDFAPPVIVTASDFRFVVQEQLLDEGIDPGAVIVEPVARNTAPAVLAAALHLSAIDPDTVMLIAPSDHTIADQSAFLSAVDRAVGAAIEGRIVTFGIVPTRAETAYGWLELSGPLNGDVVALSRFVEKPDPVLAQSMLAAGNFLWNSGIFLVTARNLIAAFEEYAPHFIRPVMSSLKEARTDLGFLRLDPQIWSQIDALSVDYAVMERARNLSVVHYEGAWNDLGGWDAVALEMGADEAGNSLSGNATAIDCRETLLRSDSPGVELVGIGLENMIAIAMNDAVLVADRRRSQDVRKAVEALKAKGAKQSEAFATDHRPWGWYETLAISDRFQVKRIVVKPGGSLSLQSHLHRSEHWIVVSGTARVTIGDKIILLTENQSVYIPLGQKHRLENPGKLPMVLIEVQTGAYLGEDDITRYNDVYARGSLGSA